MLINEIAVLSEDLFFESDINQIITSILDETTEWIEHSNYESFASHMSGIFEGRDDKKKKRPQAGPAPAQSMPENAMIVRTCPIFDESMKAHPDSRSTIEEFVKFKFKDPTGLFNPKKPKELFVGGGPFGLLGLSIRHTHVDGRDLSIVHRYYDKSPIYLDLYGVFSHKELGTTTPPNIRRQQQMAQRFKNQSFVKWVDNLSK